jgi:hypothetical protein
MLTGFDKSGYLAGYNAGRLFVERYRAYPKLVLKYAQFHHGRYRQTANDDGFIDAIFLACGQ